MAYEPIRTIGNPLRVSACRALPHKEDPPSGSDELGRVSGIALRVPADLAAPKPRPRSWNLEVLAAGMAVPETTMNLDRDAVAGKNNVGATRQPVIMEDVAESTREQQSSHNELRHRVAWPDSPHHARSG